MKCLIIFLSFLISAGNYCCQEFNSASLFEYAKKNSPQLLNSAVDVFISDEKIKEVRASGLPKINGEVSFQNFINVPTTVIPASSFNPGAQKDELLGVAFGTPFNANYNLKISQLIFSFRYVYGLKAARNFSELSRLANLQKNETVYENIRMSLGQVIMLEKMQEIMNQNLTEIKILKKKTNKLIQAGVIDKNSINDILVLELDINSGLEEFQSNTKLAVLSLKSIIGFPADSTLDLISDFEVSGEDSFNFHNAMDTKNNNAYKIGEQNVFLNTLNFKTTKSEGYPSVFGFFNQQHMAMRNNFDFFDSKKDWYPSTVWGINVTIPIYNSGEGKSKTNQKRLALVQSENELKLIESQIFNLYEMLKSNYNSAYLNYKNQKTKLVLIEGVYKNEERKLSLGASNSLSLSQRKMQFLQAQQQLILKEFELYKAEIQIKTHTNPIKL